MKESQIQRRNYWNELLFNKSMLNNLARLSSLPQHKISLTAASQNTQAPHVKKSTAVKWAYKTVQIEAFKQA